MDEHVLVDGCGRTPAWMQQSSAGRWPAEAGAWLAMEQPLSDPEDLAAPAEGAGDGLETAANHDAAPAAEDGHEERRHDSEEAEETRSLRGEDSPPCDDRDGEFDDEDFGLSRDASRDGANDDQVSRGSSFGSKQSKPREQHQSYSSGAPALARDESRQDGLRKYLKLVDFGGLAMAMRGTDEQLEQQNERLATVEQLIDKFPTEYVTAEEVRESTERMDYLSKKIKTILDTSERTQKVDSIRLTGELNALSAAFNELGARVSQFETEQRATHDALRDLRHKLDDKVSIDELRGVRLQVQNCALKTQLSDVQAAIESRAQQADLDALRERIEAVADPTALSEHLDAKIKTVVAPLKDALASMANVEDLERVEDSALDALDTAKLARSSVELANSQLETFGEQIEVLNTAMHRKVNVEDMRSEAEAIMTEITRVVDDVRAAHSLVAEQVEAINDTVGTNSRGMDRFEAEVARIDSELEQRISTADWEQIEADLVDTFATKEQVASSVEPIVQKLNQVVAKLIEVDKVLASRADATTCVENREHIEDLFRIVSGLQASAARAPPDAGAQAGRAGEAAVDTAPNASAHQSSKSQQGSRRGSAGHSALVDKLEAKVSEQAAAITRLEKRLAQAEATSSRAMERSGRGSVSEIAKLERHDAQLGEIAEQLADLRNVLLKRADAGGLEADRPVVRQGDLAVAPMLPRRPSGGAASSGLAGPRPILHAPSGGAFELSSDKEAWDRTEKQRWLSETRAAEPTRPAPGPGSASTNLPPL